MLALAGRYALGEFCELHQRPRPVPGGAPARRGVAAVSPLDVSQRRAGPGAAPGGPAAARGARARAAADDVRRLAAARRAADAGADRSRLARYPTLRFKLDATSSWTPELIAALARSGAVDSIDFKALYRGTIVDQAPDPVLYERVVAAFPDAWIEDPDVVTAGTRRRWPRTRPHHLGRPHPFHRRHRGAAVRPEDGQHQALAHRRPAQSCATPTTTAPSTASAPTAAASSSSGRAAGRPSTSLRCFTPTRPTTSLPVGFTSTTRRRACRPSPLPRAADAIGFRWSWLSGADSGVK